MFLAGLNNLQRKSVSVHEGEARLAFLSVQHPREPVQEPRPQPDSFLCATQG